MEKDQGKMGITDSQRREKREKQAEKSQFASAMIGGDGVPMGNHRVYITKGGKEGQVKIRSVPVTPRKTA